MSICRIIGLGKYTVYIYLDITFQQQDGHCTLCSIILISCKHRTKISLSKNRNPQCASATLAKSSSVCVCMYICAQRDLHRVNGWIGNLSAHRARCCLPYSPFNASSSHSQPPLTFLCLGTHEAGYSTLLRAVWGLMPVRLSLPVTVKSVSDASSVKQRFTRWHTSAKCSIKHLWKKDKKRRKNWMSSRERLSVNATMTTTSREVSRSQHYFVKSGFFWYDFLRFLKEFVCYVFSSSMEQYLSLAKQLSRSRPLTWPVPTHITNFM